MPARTLRCRWAGFWDLSSTTGSVYATAPPHLGSRPSTNFWLRRPECTETSPMALGCESCLAAICWAAIRLYQIKRRKNMGRLPTRPLWQAPPGNFADHGKQHRMRSTTRPFLLLRWSQHPHRKRGKVGPSSSCKRGCHRHHLRRCTKGTWLDSPSASSSESETFRRKGALLSEGDTSIGLHRSIQPRHGAVVQ